MKLFELIFSALLVTLGLLGFPSQAAGQNVYAAIHGTLTDPSGAVVPNVAVTALNTSTGISTQSTTDSKGYYILPQLQVGGPYTVEAPDFQQYQTGLMLVLNDDRERAAIMAIRSGQDSLSVCRFLHGGLVCAISKSGLTPFSKFPFREDLCG